MVHVILWIVLALMWSSSFAAIKIGIETVDSMPLVAGRMLIGAFVLLVFLKLRGLSLCWTRKSISDYAFTGFVGGVIPFLLITFGEHHVDSGLAALLMGISPVSTVVLAHLILHDETMTTKSVLGVGLGVTGVLILVGPGVLSELGSHVIGQLCIILAALCYSSSTIYIKRVSTRPAMEMAAGSMVVGAVSITAATIALGDPAGITMPSSASLLAVVYLGLFPTALATLIYFYLVPHLGANRMSQVNFVVPVGGAVMGVVLLGETLTPSMGAALAVIMMAIYLVSSRRKASGKVAA